MAGFSKKYIKQARKKPGGSNVGKKRFASGKKRTGPYAGPGGGAPKGSYPIPDLAHARSALRLSGHAPNPSGIKAKVYAKYPQLRKAQTGGMYDAANTIPAGIGSTAMTVFQENNPQTQAQREARLLQMQRDANLETTNIADEINKNKEDAQNKIQGAASDVEAKFTAGEEGLSTILEKAEDINLLDKSNLPGTPKFNFNPLANPITAQQPPGSTFQSVTGSLDPNAGIAQINPISTPDYLNPSTYGPTPKFDVNAGITKNIGSKVAAQGATKLSERGAWMTQGLGKAGSAANLINPAAIASLAGTGIKMLSDEGDPTRTNVGELGGSILSSAGTGAAIGSIIPGIGNLVGAGVGAVYGAGKELVMRNKARAEKSKQDATRRAQIREHKGKVEGNLASQLANVRAGEMKQKTYSGYDLGRNVTYQKGGFGWNVSRDPSINKALNVATGTFLGGVGIRSGIPTLQRLSRKNKAWNLYSSAQDDVYQNMGWDDWADYCQNNPCPTHKPFTPSRQDFLSGEYSAFGTPPSTETNAYFRQAGVLPKWQYRDKLWEGVKKSGKQAIASGLLTYGADKLLDKTKWGRKFKNKFDLKLGLKFQDGGFKNETKKYKLGGFYGPVVKYI